MGGGIIMINDQGLTIREGGSWRGNIMIKDQ